MIFDMTQITLATDHPLPTDLATLGQATQDNVRQAVTASKAANTLRAYKSDLRQVAAYLFEVGHTRLVKPDPTQLNRWVLVTPMSPALVAGYLADKAAQGVAISSLRRHVASLSKWHQLAATNGLDIANPCDTALVRDTLAGLRRANQRTPDKAAPILEHHLVAMVKTLDMGTLKGHRNRALLLLGWCAALRRSELAALTWDCVKFVPGEGLVVTLKNAKTDQTGEGQQVGVPYQANAELCPVRSLREWQEVAQGDLSGPVFTQIGQHGNNLTLAMSGQAVGNVVAQVSTNAGLEGFTGHSLRAGLATAAILAGRAEHEVMNTTRHKSQAVFRGYVRHAELLPKAASRGLLS
jgi:site-specific recombinase XerD